MYKDCLGWAMDSDILRFTRNFIEEGSKGIPCSLRAYAMAFSAGTFASSTLQEGRGLRLLVIGYTFNSVIPHALAC
jgi:hypothetical protein